MDGRVALHAFTTLGWTDGPMGVWRNRNLVPDRQVPDLDWWIEFARTAERGCMDTVFFADAIGMAGFSDGDLDPEIRDGRTILWDPSMFVSAMSRETDHIGFVFTSSILQDHPFTFARKMSTLDHITGGRIGWNIVTSYSPNAARNVGLAELPSREERYRWADEYVRVAYRLWEGSWDEDALTVDRATGTYVDPAKVHLVNYAGQRYRVQGPHLTPPTPQRTPFLAQAGGSGPGQQFAATHAEVQFIVGDTDQVLSETVRKVRELAVRAGRRADDITFTLSSRFVVGSTTEEARRKADELDDAADPGDVIDYMSTSMGIDFSGVSLDDRVPELLTFGGNGGMSGVLDSLTEGFPAGYVPTLRDLVRNYRSRGRFVGTPEQIADRVERLRDIGVTGLMVSMDIRPRSLTDFVDQVVPVLQRRGLSQREYASGTLRQRLMGYGDRLPDRHPAAAYRPSRVGR